MSTERKGSEPELDQAISAIRNEAIDAGTVRQAADRVWARLAAEAPAQAGEVEAIHGCAEFETLIPAWREGRLEPARALLVEDHVHACPRCRKAFTGAKPPIVMQPRRTAPVAWKWAAAAAVIVASGLSVWMLADKLGVPSGPRATVATLDGTLYHDTAALPVGAPIAEQESVRTARGSGAVIRLRDGSLVEMRERTQLALSERRDGLTIRLASGSVIVQAAKQRSRHLYVATDDCLVSVTGTIFSVNHGLKGSRVAVVEGEVRVEQGQSLKVLHPGDQTVTSARLTPVSLMKRSPGAATRTSTLRCSMNWRSSARSSKRCPDRDCGIPRVLRTWRRRAPCSTPPSRTLALRSAKRAACSTNSSSRASPCGSGGPRRCRPPAEKRSSMRCWRAWRHSAHLSGPRWR